MIPDPPLLLPRGYILAVFRGPQTLYLTGSLVDTKVLTDGAQVHAFGLILCGVRAIA
jgi:hypothetical protein